MPSCGISQILESTGPSHPSSALYEVFCVFKESGVGQANVDKLIKLYVNR